MINIILCDDDRMFCEYVNSNIFPKISFKHTTSIFYGYDKELKNYIIKNKVPTIYILDIRLNQRDIDGYTIAKAIHHIYSDMNQIIFLTNEEHPTKEIINKKINPIRFINKTFGYEEELLAAIEEGREKILNAIAKRDGQDDWYVKLTSNYKDYVVSGNRIIYFELTEEKKVTVYFVDSDRVNYITITSTMNGMLKKVSKAQDIFIKISRSVAINKNHVMGTDYEKNTIKMDYRIEIKSDKKTIKEVLKCTGKLF